MPLVLLQEDVSLKEEVPLVMLKGDELIEGEVLLKGRVPLL